MIGLSSNVSEERFIEQKPLDEAENLASLGMTVFLVCGAY